MSGYLKRKRVYGPGLVMKPYAKPSPLKRTKRFVPGVDRIGGYYGRYSGIRSAGELKFHDTTLVDAVVAAAGGILNSVNLIPQGVTEVQRIGRKCTLKSFWWRYELSLPEQDAQTTPESGDSVRMIVYQDKQTNGATAVLADILEATVSIQSFRNLANQGRFIILCDKIHSINYAGLASDGAGVVSQAAVSREYTLYKKLNVPIEFDSTTGAITEIRSNNIGILLISTNGVVGFNSKIRLRFSDGGA